MRIRLSERETFRGPWRVRIDERADNRTAELPPLSESSELAVSVTFEDGDDDADLEVRVGHVLVASSRPNDRTDFQFYPAPGDDGWRRLTCAGPLLRDW